MDHCIGRDHAGLSLGLRSLRKGDGGDGRLLHPVFALNLFMPYLPEHRLETMSNASRALPMITAILFLAGTWLHFDMGEPAFFSMR
ncbi:MAG: hypothetical protein ACLU38_02575 [Dysosmobacter sp.]